MKYLYFLHLFFNMRMFGIFEKYTNNGQNLMHMSLLLTL